MRPSLASSDGLFVYADAYKLAADAVFALTRSGEDAGEVRVPCVFLYFRSIELALKSVLISHGVSELEITRTLGHRLSQLLRRAAEFPKFDTLYLTAADIALINKYSAVYADKWFEYPEDSPADYPNLDSLQDLRTRMLKAMRAFEPTVE